MKLRNRESGEVVDGYLILKTEDHKDPWYCESIADLVEHWEDYNIDEQCGEEENDTSEQKD